MIRAWSFQNKVTTGFAVLIGSVALTTMIAVYALRTTVAVEDDLISRNAQGLIEAARLDAAFNEEAAAFRGPAGNVCPV
jgi:hypothetical protein